MYKASVFFISLVVYAAFSTPTPDGPGWAELAVACGLMLAVGVQGGVQAAGFSPADSAAKPRWMPWARFALLWGLSVPLISAFAAGHPSLLIVRDVIPFLFLLLPLFLPASLLEGTKAGRLMPWVLCLMGLIFVVRVLGVFVATAGHPDFAIGFVPDSDNLVNAPTVLFAALFLTGYGGYRLIHATTARSFAMALTAFVAALFLLAGMAAIGQRAHIGAWALACLIWLAILLVRQPRALGRLLPLILVAAVFMWPVAFDIVQGLMQKTSVVGLNNRAEEVRIVWDSFQGRPWALLFGQGWGATIISPAVGPFPVNYTHNLMTTYLLKTGIFGLILILSYLFWIAAGIWRILWVQPVAAVALAAPFLIDLTLYASFKSLDFGLLLVLTTLWTRWPAGARESCQKTPGWCMQDHNHSSG